MVTAMFYHCVPGNGPWETFNFVHPGNYPVVVENDNCIIIVGRLSVLIISVDYTGLDKGNIFKGYRA